MPLSGALAFAIRGCPASRYAWILLVLFAGIGTASAFPLLDPANQSQVPGGRDAGSDGGTDLAPGDQHDLQRQLQLSNGLVAPAGGGWTIVPRIDVQEELTDNVLQQHSPREFDFATFIAPSLGIAADLPRLQLNFDIAPTLAIYGVHGSLNQLTEQMNGVGLVTVAPDWAYIDLRATSGVHSQYGGLGGLGTLGAGPNTGIATPGNIPSLAGDSLGLTKYNAAQTSSFSISPYLLHQFGDIGTAKLGYSFGASQSNQLSSFAPSPFPTGGANTQSLTSNEETLNFVSGDIWRVFGNTFNIDLLQDTTRTQPGYLLANGTTAPQTGNSSSTRSYITDQVTYQATREFALFAVGGYEKIAYSNRLFRNIEDLIWSIGTTLTPNPDSSLTVSYGHRDGFNSFSAAGYYQLTARTLLSVSYGSTLGTQLETVQNQLNLAAPGQGGNLVNAQTGGSLFTNINGLLLQDGVFRTNTFVLGSQTSLDRDIISLQLAATEQTSQSTGSRSTSSSKTVTGTWTHQMNPQMILSSSLAVSWTTQSALSTANPGNNTSIFASVAWQYQFTPSLGVNARYAFFDRQSQDKAFSAYQNLFILGLSKTF